MLECKVCGKKFVKNNIVSHINNKHGLSGKEYKLKYNSPVLIQSEETKKKISKSVKNNNFYSVKYWTDRGFTEEEAVNHIHELAKSNSVRSVKYWTRKGYSEIEARRKISEIQTQNAKRQRASKYRWLAEGHSLKEATDIAKGYANEKSILSKEYWINRHGMTEIEAIEKISSIQSYNSSKSSKFAGHKRTDEQKKKISKSMKAHIRTVGISKWHSHFGDLTNGKSLLEEEVQSYVKEQLSTPIENNIGIGRYNVDILYENKVIEVFGDYWHANPNLYTSSDVITYPGNRVVTAQEVWDKDARKIEVLKNLGYEILIVWESDWRENLSNTQKIIMDFLYAKE